MISGTDLAPFFALGLLGSFHCLGMCGGFALAIANSSAPLTPSAALRRQLAYVTGKASTYAILGALVATGSAWLLGEKPGGQLLPSSLLTHAQRVLEALTGLALIALGATGLGWWVPPRSPRLLAPLVSASRGLLAGARALPGLTGVFAVGIVNGMLPCGLSWAALLLASRVDPSTAALGAFLFGLGTAPVLLAAGLTPRCVPLFARPSGRLLLGLVLIAFGVHSLVRAVRHSVSFSQGLPECCCTDGAGGPSPIASPFTTFEGLP